MGEALFSLFPDERFLDLGLYQYGWERCDPGHSFGPASRNHFLFHYIISGKGTLYGKDFVCFHLKSGQGFLLFPGEVTQYIADSEFPWEYTWVEFDGIKAREYVYRSGLTKDNPVYNIANGPLASGMMNEMLYIARHSADSSLQLIAHLYLFLDYFVRSSSSAHLEKEEDPASRYVREACVYIERNYQKSMTVADIAEAAALSRGYFSRLFHERTGKTVQEYLIEYRMQRAAELMLTTPLSIAQVANSVGYENPLHFSRAFKNVYGVAPRDWRKENKVKVEG